MKKLWFTAAVLVLAFPSLCFADAVQPAPKGRVVFYQNDECTTGDRIVLGRGAYSDLRQWNTAELGSPTWNDRISCLVIGEGIRRVTVFQHINYKGKSKTFSRTDGNPRGIRSLAGDWFNNNISSIKIE
mgnify:FL=1